MATVSGQTFEVTVVGLDGTERHAALGIEEIVDAHLAGALVWHGCGEEVWCCPEIAPRLELARERLGAPLLRFVFEVAGLAETVMTIARCRDEAADAAASQVCRVFEGTPAELVSAKQKTLTGQHLATRNVGEVVAAYNTATRETVWERP